MYAGCNSPTRASQNSDYLRNLTQINLKICKNYRLISSGTQSLYFQKVLKLFWYVFFVKLVMLNPILNFDEKVPKRQASEFLTIV